MDKMTTNVNGDLLADWVDELNRTHTLPDTPLLALLRAGSLSDEADAPWQQRLTQLAEAATQRIFGTGIYLRGLVEISNHCRNGCFYCGLRAENTHVQRYRLSADDILECCRRGYALGLRTFVFQGGEDVAHTDDWVVEMVRAVRAEFPDCAITLSLGERTDEAYRRFREAGADRYLLRHETADAAHYARLHPASMSFANRLRCLQTLKTLGYQTGMGMMVGSPFQTPEMLLADLRLMQRLQPEMIGIGPFVPQRDTPFASFPAGSVELTVGLISILRLMFPKALIPATTALATLAADGRRRGIQAGANVVMPNLSPDSARANYRIYDNKAFSGNEAAENICALDAELHVIGRQIDFGRGDAPA